MDMSSKDGNSISVIEKYIDKNDPDLSPGVSSVHQNYHSCFHLGIEFKYTIW